MKFPKQAAVVAVSAMFGGAVVLGTGAGCNLQGFVETPPQQVPELFAEAGDPGPFPGSGNASLTMAAFLQVTLSAPTHLQVWANCNGDHAPTRPIAFVVEFTATVPAASANFS